MLKAVLFDLDGTLVPLDHDRFVKSYLSQLASNVAHVVEPKRFVNQLLASTANMVNNRDSQYTNEQVFMRDFFSGIGVEEEILRPLFDDFYANDFHKIGVVARSSTAARQAVSAVLTQGLDAVLATNPLFPLIAVKQRMQWGNIADMPFKHITSYETSHYCKPHTEYYLEIADNIGVKPDECLMVGNDVEEDLAAAKVGMKTYLVTDCLLNFKGLEPKADYTGSLQEMADFLSSGELF